MVKLPTAENIGSIVTVIVSFIKNSNLYCMLLYLCAFFNLSLES